MKFCWLLLATSAAAQIPPAAWKPWAPREEIAPRTYVDPVVRKQPGAGSLAISGNSNPAAFGGWQTEVQDVRPGSWYRFTAWYRAQGATYERLQVLAKLDWQTAGGKRAGQPDYVSHTVREGDWNFVMTQAPAPEHAASVRLQLLIENAPSATVWWDQVDFHSVAAPVPRIARVRSVNLRPRGGAPVDRFLEVVDRIPDPVDVVLLPEGITVVGTGKQYSDVAESLPGPTSAKLGEMARKKHCYIVAGLYEREGPAIYNTAVLIDRQGRLAGKYRKVYLPREEVEGGLTPGSDYPVFQTDFGKVGLMICWDLQYSDPARALALRGAEVILMPIWGGNLALGKARAIENQVFLASSGYDYPSMILDPNGETLSQAPAQGSWASADIDLNRRYVDPWLGDMRDRLRKEIRLDVAVP